MCCWCQLRVLEAGNYSISVAHLDTLQQAVRDMSVQVDPFPYAGVACGNDNGHAIIYIGDMAQESLVQDGVHRLPVILASCCATLDLCSGSHRILVFTYSHKALVKAPQLIIGQHWGAFLQMTSLEGAEAHTSAA